MMKADQLVVKSADSMVGEWVHLMDDWKVESWEVNLADYLDRWKVDWMADKLEKMKADSWGHEKVGSLAAKMVVS